MDDKIDLIYDIVKDIDSKQEKANDRLTKLEVNVDRNSESLDRHIEGVVQTRELISQNRERYNQKHEELKEEISGRLQQMEQPKIAVKLVSKWIVGLGALAGAVFTMLKLYKAI